MSDVPQLGRDPRRTVRDALLRVGAMLLGLLIGVVVLAARFATGKSLGPIQLLLLYLGLTAFIWGLNGFAFRRLPLSFPLVLPLFSAAAFGVLFLLGYILGAVAGPFLFDAANSLVPYVHVADLVFYLFAVMTIAGAAGTAFSRNIIYSAWALLFAFLGVAGLYVFLGADFPAVAQVLIYVGGILVLILFAIMLTKQIGGDPHLTNAHIALPAGAALAAAMVAILTYTAVMAPWSIVPERSWQPISAALGIAFLTEYLLPFEIASVVLLAALVGAVVIARKEIKETSEIMR